MMLESDDFYYQQFVPHSILRRYIDCYWILRAPASHSAGGERLPASGTVEIMFNFGGPSRAYKVEADEQTHLQSESFIVGARNQGFRVEQMGASHYIAIRFKPGGFAPFTRFPLVELANQRLNLDLIFGNRIRFLEECLF